MLSQRWRRVSPHCTFNGDLFPKEVTCSATTPYAHPSHRDRARIKEGDLKANLCAVNSELLGIINWPGYRYGMHSSADRNFRASAGKPSTVVCLCARLLPRGAGTHSPPPFLFLSRCAQGALNDREGRWNLAQSLSSPRALIQRSS